MTAEAIARSFLPTLEPGRALAPREWRTLVSVAEVLVDGGPHGIPAHDIADNVERFLVRGRSRRAWRVRVLLECIELFTLPTHGRRFSALSFDERKDVVRSKWVAGRGLGRICGKVRNLVLVGAYGDPRAATQLGYVPVQRRRRLQQHLAGTGAEA